MDTDFLVIRKIKSGDDAAGDEFIRKYYSEILKYISFHCYNQEDAKDLTQETFIHFFEKVNEYRHEGKAKNYLYTIARNLCIDNSRRLKSVRYEQEEVLYEIGKEDAQIQQTEDQIALDWALKQLPDELRSVIILYYFQELNIREIADILQIGVPLTKYRLKQAKQKLHEIMRMEVVYES